MDRLVSCDELHRVGLLGADFDDAFGTEDFGPGIVAVSDVLRAGDGRDNTVLELQKDGAGVVILRIFLRLLGASEVVADGVDELDLAPRVPSHRVKIMTVHFANRPVALAHVVHPFSGLAGAVGVGFDHGDIADRAGVDQFFSSSETLVESSHKAELELYTGYSAGLDHLVALFFIERHGLLAEDMFAGLRGGDHDVVVEAGGRYDDHCVDLGVLQGFIVIFVDVGNFNFARCGFQALCHRVAEGDELRAADVARIVSRVDHAGAAAADEAYFQFLVHKFGSLSCCGRAAQRRPFIFCLGGAAYLLPAIIVWPGSLLAASQHYLAGRLT